MYRSSFFKYLLPLLFAVPILQGQEAHHNLKGYFEVEGNSMYGFFIFYGNGKVNIAGMDEGEYFVKADSIFVYPDKSIFKFKWEGDRILGVSNWVDQKIWKKRDTLIQNPYPQTKGWEKRAQLLAEYYENSPPETDQMALLFNEAAMKEHQNNLEQLCDRGLPKACSELFGYKFLEEQGGLQNLLSNASRPKSKNKELLSLGERMVALGDREGHTLLAAYLYHLGKEEEAYTELQLAIEKGSLKAALMEMEMESESKSKNDASVSPGKK